MTVNREQANRILEHLLELLDIPKEYYELATQRYTGLAEWLHREDSTVMRFDPAVYPQGSFRLGTVIRPLSSKEEFDLDLVSALTLLCKSDLSQAELKRLIGEEVRAFANARGIKEPVKEKNRCWRLDYADSVRFHMDVLPAIPDDEAFRNQLAQLGVGEHLAEHALAITDRTHPNYSTISDDWPRSNPKGYALWFEGRMQVIARQRRVALVEQRVYASVDDVPAYEWKTPLQRAVQILKRHRDVMFEDQPDLKPISIILSTLSAEAYEGEADLYTALSKILERMPGLIRSASPRVPNPVNPAEDFADKWASDPRLERSFHAWHQQACADIHRLAGYIGSRDLSDLSESGFGLCVPMERCKHLADSQDDTTRTPKILVGAAPRPWCRG
jgi:hypothetical protein